MTSRAVSWLQYGLCVLSGKERNKLIALSRRQHGFGQPVKRAAQKPRLRRGQTV